MGFVYIDYLRLSLRGSASDKRVLGDPLRGRGIDAQLRCITFGMCRGPQERDVQSRFALGEEEGVVFEASRLRSRSAFAERISPFVGESVMPAELSAVIRGSDSAEDRGRGRAASRGENSPLPNVVVVLKASC